MGELQRLKLRHCYLLHDSCPGGGLVHYPAINLQAIGVRFARGTGVTKQEQLKDEVEDAVKELASDVDLFGKVDGDGRAQ